MNENLIDQAREKYREELRRFISKHPEYILVIKDAEDLAYYPAGDDIWTTKNYSFVNELSAKAKVVIKGKYQNAIRHEDWDNIEMGGIVIEPKQDDRVMKAFFSTKPDSFKEEPTWVIGKTDNIKKLGVKRIHTGDFLHVLSNTDGCFIWYGEEEHRDSAMIIKQADKAMVKKGSVNEQQKLITVELADYSMNSLSDIEGVGSISSAIKDKYLSSAMEQQFIMLKKRLPNLDVTSLLLFYGRILGFLNTRTPKNQERFDFLPIPEFIKQEVFAAKNIKDYKEGMYVVEETLKRYEKQVFFDSPYWLDKVMKNVKINGGASGEIILRDLLVLMRRGVFAYLSQYLYRIGGASSITELLQERHYTKVSMPHIGGQEQFLPVSELVPIQDILEKYHLDSEGKPIGSVKDKAMSSKVAAFNPSFILKMRLAVSMLPNVQKGEYSREAFINHLDLPDIYEQAFAIANPGKILQEEDRKRLQQLSLHVTQVLTAWLDQRTKIPDDSMVWLLSIIFHDVGKVVALQNHEELSDKFLTENLVIEKFVASGLINTKQADLIKLLVRYHLPLGLMFMGEMNFNDWKDFFRDARLRTLVKQGVLLKDILQQIKRITFFDQTAYSPAAPFKTVLQFQDEIIEQLSEIDIDANDIDAKLDVMSADFIKSRIKGLVSWGDINLDQPKVYYDELMRNVIYRFKTIEPGFDSTRMYHVLSRINLRQFCIIAASLAWVAEQPNSFEEFVPAAENFRNISAGAQINVNFVKLLSVIVSQVKTVNFSHVVIEGSDGQAPSRVVADDPYQFAKFVYELNNILSKEQSVDQQGNNFFFLDEHGQRLSDITRMVIDEQAATLKIIIDSGTTAVKNEQKQEPVVAQPEIEQHPGELIPFNRAKINPLLTTMQTVKLSFLPAGQSILFNVSGTITHFVDFSVGDPDDKRFIITILPEDEPEEKAYILTVGNVDTDVEGTAAQLKIVDSAVLSDVGGIDMTKVGFKREASPASHVVQGKHEIIFNFDPAMLEQFQSGNFKSFQAVITNVTPLPSVLPLLGLSLDKKNKAG
ncbi:MAG: hypothetical protein HQL26_04315 [Candidatus Omnitrophica bacterium]|nr:hypothetical protein [Candidatus Omnitrophota bacterium]